MRTAALVTAASFALLLGPPLAGCTDAPRPVNPSFPVSFWHAQKALDEMAADPRPLRRPLVLVGGYMDWFAVNPAVIKGELDRALVGGADRVRVLALPITGSLADQGRWLVDEVERAFPSDDPDWTTEVDVIGFSLGGLIPRVAAAPADDPARPKRLRLARLFSVGSPHRGSVIAARLGFTEFHRDLAPGSAFMARLAARDAAAEYEVIPYVLLGDSTVGARNAAPPGVAAAWWLAGPTLLSHYDAMFDRRIVADIARRLRDEPPLSTYPPAPLPSNYDGD
jgi:hypothetical protein